MIDKYKLLEQRPEWRNTNCIGHEEYNKGWNECNTYWCNTIKAQPKIKDWIPVSEKLPDKGIEMIIWITYETKGKRFVRKGRWQRDRFTTIEMNKPHYTIVAWQPYAYPEPYQGE